MDLLGANGNNNIAIGHFAQVPTVGGSNQIRLGNTSATYAGIQIGWSITSDSRLKNNIQNSNLGLKFINELRPVSYFRKNDDTEKLEYGFIAQELEQALHNNGASNNGILTIDYEGTYSVRYNDLFAPIVKAIQELKNENDFLRSQNEVLLKRLLLIEDKLKL
jgi:trimeric autotransporter adhesin